MAALARSSQASCDGCARVTVRTVPLLRKVISSHWIDSISRLNFATLCESGAQVGPICGVDPLCGQIANRRESTKDTKSTKKDFRLEALWTRNPVARLSSS